MSPSNQSKPKRKYKPNIKINASSAIEGRWDIWEIDPARFPGKTDDEIISEVHAQFVRHKKQQNCPLFADHVRPAVVYRKNKVVNGLIDTIIHRMIGTYTGSEDLVARRLAIGHSNNTPTINDAQLGLEFYRTTFIDQFQDSNKATFIVFVNRTQGNGNSTTVVTDGGNTATSFKVQTGQTALFNIGDRIRVTTTSGFNFTTITNLDGINDIITVSGTEPLLDTPVNPNPVMQVWAEAAIFGNTGASNTLNTGVMFNRVNQLEYAKDNTKIILIQVQFILTSL